MIDRPASLRGYLYKPRTIAFQGHRPLGRWQVKGTVVTVRGTAAHFAEIVEGAWLEAANLLSAFPDDGRDAGIAHMIAHLVLGGVGLSLDWWSDGDMLRTRSVRAPFDDPLRFAEGGPVGRAPPCGKWRFRLTSARRGCAMCSGTRRGPTSRPI